MERGQTSSGNNNNKLERKTIEKNRRLRMKDLCFKLVSIIPPHHFNPPKEFLSQQDQLEQTASYIKILREKIEDLRKRKTALMNAADGNNNSVTMGGSKSPVLKIRDLSGSSLEVVLICGLQKKFMLADIISIIEEEGAEVVTVTLSNIDDKIFHTLHAQAKVSRVGVETKRMCERIQELIS